MKLGALRQSLEREHALASSAGHRERARAHRLTVYVHRARSALSNAAAELRSLDVEHVAQHPQKRHLGLDIHLPRPSIHTQLDHSGLLGLGADMSVLM